ncbi:MAG: BglII/BstYI family type II restriction endonuclease [Haliea sp.]
MKIVQRHSHLNGFEFLMYHQPKIWAEIERAIKSVNAEKCRTKVSEEKTMKGKLLYSPEALNREFESSFNKMGWRQRQTTNWLCEDIKMVKEIVRLKPDEQKERILERGLTPIRTYNQTDFVKDRVAVEVQLGKYAFVAHDLFVKHMSFFVNDDIDVGVEIVPMKIMEQQMSSGVAYFERDLFNMLRQGRGIPAVPIILIGIKP